MAVSSMCARSSESLSVSIIASHTELWLLSSDSERELIEGCRLEERLCSNSILALYELLDLERPEFVGVDDLEHTLVLLLLRVLRVNQQEYFVGTLALCETAQVHECTLGEKSEISVCQPDIEPATREVHQTRVLAESL